MRVGFIGKYRECQFTRFLLARQRDGILDIDTDNIGAAIQRFRKTVGTQTGNEKQAAARSDLCLGHNLLLTLALYQYEATIQKAVNN
jgi:hypothetical protein